jgi:hypothetical protein
LSKLFRIYGVFYSNINGIMKDHEEITGDNGDNANYEGGFLDGAGGFESYNKKAPENKGSDGVWKELGALVDAFSQEVDIVEPVVR